MIFRSSKIVSLLFLRMSNIAGVTTMVVVTQSFGNQNASHKYHIKTASSYPNKKK